MKRSDCIIDNIKDEVIKLLKETKLSHSEIGKTVGCSRGPVYKIKKLYGIERENIRNKSRLDLKCHTCDTLIKNRTLDKRRSHQRIYCSNICRFQGYRESDRIKVNCLLCGNKFIETHKRIESGRGKFCSRKCIYKYKTEQNTVIVKCEVCKKEKVIPKSKISKTRIHFCSLLCQSEYQIKQNNPNWKGGTTPLRSKLQWGSRYSEWRTDIFERDNYTCRMCGDVGGKLNAHHIVLVSKDISRVFDINNGATVCLGCHRSIKGKEEQYESYFV